MKADMKFNCNCGCGFKSDSIYESVKHVEETGHSVSVVGQVFKKEAEHGHG